MSTSASRYPDWKAPADDGQVLLWPDPVDLLEHTHVNRRRLSSAHELLIQNVPLPKLRRWQRQWLGHEDVLPVIGAGHQTELMHPGVWVKDVVIDYAAQKLGGEAYHFAVDTDEPKHLQLRWPGGAAPLTEGSVASAAWAGLLEVPTPAHLKEVESQLAADARSWPAEPMTGPFFASMRRQAMESTNLCNALTNSIHEINWDLGLRHHALVVSPIWLCDGYLTFAHHILARAAEFATSYNAALAHYRADNRIRGNMRPMPDLQISADQVEVPFWLDSLADGTRTRGHVSSRDGRFALHVGGEQFDLDPARDGFEVAQALSHWLRDRQLRLAPRAITLTMFLRLLVVDQFVHGIGGGRYDQITDRIIQQHFGIDPPSFCVTTATLYFPTASSEQRACVPCVMQEGHRLEHSLLGEEKMRLVERIESAPRLSNQRRQIFQDMHRRLSAAAAVDPAMHAWREKLRATDQQAKSQEEIFDRELFFAIQPRQRLENIMAVYSEAFG